jgi:hypothetical protein
MKASLPEGAVNVTAKVIKNKLVLEIDLAQAHGETKSSVERGGKKKSLKVASTSGWGRLENGTSFSLNVVRSEPR